MPTQGYWGPRTFIAAQTPLPDTIADFWSMVYQKKVSTIVMLSGGSEGDKVLKVSCTYSIMMVACTLLIEYTIHALSTYMVNTLVSC